MHIPASHRQKYPHFQKHGPVGPDSLEAQWYPFLLVLGSLIKQPTKIGNLLIVIISLLGFAGFNIANYWDSKDLKPASPGGRPASRKARARPSGSIVAEAIRTSMRKWKASGSTSLLKWLRWRVHVAGVGQVGRLRIRVHGSSQS